MDNSDLLSKARFIGLTSRILGIRGFFRNRKNLSSDALAFAFGKYLLDFDGESFSQFRQDLFVAFFLGGKKEGAFVEFGAADGVTHSNTLLLEKLLGWRGILIEPISKAFKELAFNRPKSLLVRAAISVDNSNYMSMTQSGQLSSLIGYHDMDVLSSKRAIAISKGEVESVPLVDLSLLLRSHFPSGNLDYISIDVEGAELAIISRFDFSVSPSIFTIEYNNRKSDLDEICSIMSAKGYIRVFKEYPFYTGLDAWFVRKDLYENKKIEIGSQ
jgi:FkbM family methyltransferase